MAQKSYWATSTPSLGASSTGAACLAGKDTALAQTRQTDTSLRASGAAAVLWRALRTSENSLGRSSGSGGMEEQGSADTGREGREGR